MSLKRAAAYYIFGIVTGFSLAMGLVGDSPWSEFWLRVARMGH